MRSGSEIESALREFVSRWRGFSGSERSEAQTFLNQLFAAYGTDRQAVGARFEDFKSSAGFMDLHWPGTLIVEMKKPGVSLDKAEDQRKRYWEESSDDEAGIPAARWVIACNFHEFEIWEPGRFPKDARIRFSLEDLPDHYDSLLFLQSGDLEPVFSEHRRELTAEAARHVAELYTSMAGRSAAPVDEIQRFTMQLVWCLFAEDLGMLEGYPLQNTIEALLAEKQPDSAKDIGYLFSLLNQKGDHNRQGRYAGTKYVNGDLFASPAAVYLTRDELVHLKAAAEFDWHEVNPTIFGSLLEGVLGPERRSELGAHYTHEADILKIVVPTIVRPWRQRIDAVETAADGLSLLDELCSFTVLDPACGCGNFLYVAYRELRGLEHDLKRRIGSLAGKAGMPALAGPLPYYPITNLKGIDIERIAVMIARVTLWMGHRQMIERYGTAEPPLPLVDLSGIRAADALRVDWPDADAIIGNPPFLGDRKIRASLGNEYVEWLKNHFGVGVIDFCGYWFRLAAERLKPGQRAGLVSTNTLRENKHRLASLDYVVKKGGVITDAVSSQQWPGDAVVHVSITNWVMNPEILPDAYCLDGEDVPAISSRLRAEIIDWEPRPLLPNAGRSFIGCQLTGKGFVVDKESALQLLKDTANAFYLRPFLISEDIAKRPDQSPSRWIVDFGLETLEQAAKTPSLLEIVRKTVRQEREGKGGELERNWWQFWRPRPEMRNALENLDRYIAIGRHGKRVAIAWISKATLAGDATCVFAFDDDYSMGILLSRSHIAWAWARSSTIGAGLRYTPSSVFDTFPWPDPVTADQREAIAAACRALYARRSGLCLEHDMGLTKLYNLMDEGGFRDLAALHKDLDEAVAAAYDWPASVAQDPAELVSRLTDLNRAISLGEREYKPFR